MGRAVAFIAWTIPTVIGILAIMAQTPRDKATENVAGYLPVSLPTKLAALLGSPIVLSVSFLIVGIAIGMRFQRWRLSGAPAEVVNEDEQLGIRTSNMAFELDDLRAFASNNHVLADLNVLLGDLARRGFEVPQGRSELNVAPMSRYLHQVASYLKAGQISQARAAAKHLAQEYNRTPTASESVF